MIKKRSAKMNILAEHTQKVLHTYFMLHQKQLMFKALSRKQ